MNNKIILILCFSIMLITSSSSQLFPTPADDVMIGNEGTGRGAGVNIFLPEEILNTSINNVNSSRFWDTLSLGPLNDANSSQFFSLNNVLNINESFLQLNISGNFLRVDGTNQPTANYNWITNLTTTGNISANTLSATGLSSTGVVFVGSSGLLSVDVLSFNWDDSLDFLDLNELRMKDSNTIIMGDDLSLTIFHDGTSANMINTITGTFIFKSLASGRGFDYFVGGYGGGFDPIIQISGTGGFTWNPESVSGPAFSLITSGGTGMTVSSISSQISFSNSNFVVESNGELRIDLDSATAIEFGEAQDAGIGYNGSDLIYDSQLVGTGNHLFVNGDVGIGTGTPIAQLDISEDFNIPQTTASNIGVITMAGTAYIHSFGDNAGANIFIGEQSGNFITTGTGRNIGIGFRSLEDVTTGLSNVGLGYLSFNKLTIGNHNFALGTQSGNDLVDGDSNVLIGTFAGDELTTADDNIMIGRSAGANTAISSARNVYIGRQTGSHISGIDTDNSDDNVAIGDDAMSDFSGVPSDNVAIGQGAGQLVGGSGNIFLGKDAGAQDNTNSNLLYIHNTNTVTPLIFGNFTSRELTINGDLIITGNYTTLDGAIFGSNATCAFMISPGGTRFNVCD